MLSFAELHRRSNAQANAFRARGVSAGAKVGVLCRNHAGFVEAIAALAKLGADTVSLNTGFAAPQLRDVLERERVVAVVHDEEFRHSPRRCRPRHGPVRRLARRPIGSADAGRARELR